MMGPNDIIFTSNQAADAQSDEITRSEPDYMQISAYKYVPAAVLTILVLFMILGQLRP